MRRIRSVGPLLPIRGYISLPAVAAQLEVSRRKVLKLIHEGPLKASYIGKQLKVHFDDLAEFRQEKARGSR